MEKYVIYSGGGNGYQIYGAHPDFPEGSKKSVEPLYAKQKIVEQSGVEERRCYRFAPLRDRFLFSVIYKGCVCKEEKRTFFSTVNFYHR